LKSNLVAPYNLVDTNVLEEPTIPVSGEKTTTKIVDGVKILVSFYSTGFQSTVQNMKISITKFFQPSVTLLLPGSSIIQVYVVYLTWK
jgi:hypothetical protein